MTLTQILKQEAQEMYAVTDALMQQCDGQDLSWKPSAGTNWMTLGQLLQHCTDACGAAIKGFVTGDWGLPPDMKMEDLAPDQMLPPAETMKATESVERARALMAEDRQVAMRYIDEAGEANLLGKTMKAPWGQTELTLFQHLYHMIGHLGQHKGQLFYYLKLMGKDVNTMHLWGM